MDLGFIELIDWHAGAVLAITLATFWLFAHERLPVQSTALLCLLALMLVFGIFPYGRISRPLGPAEFLAGFGNTALVTICFLMMLGRGLVSTGALEPFVRWLARIWSFTPLLAFLLLLIFCMAASGVVNDTPIVVLLIPVLVSVAQRTSTNPAQTLLPMNYAVLIGGMATTIGTSTNLLVVGIAAEHGLPAFGLFEFAPIVATAAAIALPYLWLVAPRLLPKGTDSQQAVAPLHFDATLILKDDGYAAGHELREVLEKAKGLRVRAVLRGVTDVVRLPSIRLNAGDRLLVRDTPKRLVEFASVLGAWLHPREQRESAAQPGMRMAQALLASDSDIGELSLDASTFGIQQGLEVIGISRPGEAALLDPDHSRLRPGDAVLLRGSKEGIDSLRAAPGILMLDETVDLPHTRRAPIALLILASVVALAAGNLLPMVLASALGVAAMLLTGCLRWQEATDALSSKVVMVVVASLALGQALMATGQVEAAGNGLAALGRLLPPAALLTVLMLVMAIVTNFVSNNAAAIIGTPVAIAMAASLGIDPRPFVLAVLFGCNISYATPLGYQTNLLVMSAAGYRFQDFVRAGLPLAILMWITLTWLLAKQYALL
jgi:di/tricarboxylate transporter